MADANTHNFDKRMRRIHKRHRKMATHGVVATVGRDGLIVERARRRAPRFPWRGMFMTLAAFFVLKGALLSHLGAITYDGRVAKLQEGTVVEQIGGWVMKADPATVWVAQQIELLVK